MVNIEINGVSVEAREGSMVIEAADEAGITIPRFCYHKKLSIAANCRMCLVEVEKVGKPLPACATPVTEGMKVFTRSPKAIAAQKGVLEFLLINHPLDCPICDQGGECDLQEMAMGFGNDISLYAEGKRIVADRNIGPLIATDMTRCIHCTRCVRFGDEIAGLRELGATGRGEFTRIGTYVEHTVDSELSGNVIDLCPVGALTDKPYRYHARPWELIGHDTVSPHDCVGANQRVDTRGQRVMRVVPRENEAVNEAWLSDRDRYAYLGLGAEDRLTAPQIKKDGKWQQTDWDTALTFAAEGLKRVASNAGAEQLGALGAYSATTEELYLLQKLMRGLGSGNIDHRLRQLDFSDQSALGPYPWIGQPISDLDSLDAALLVGSNLRMEQPLLGTRLRRAVVNGAQVMAINPAAYDMRFAMHTNLAVHPNAMLSTLAAVAKALLVASGESAPEGLQSLLAGVDADADHEQIATTLKNAAKTTVLMGSLALAHPQAAQLRAMAALVARLSGARFGLLAEGGNSAGAWLAGAVPHRGAAAAATERSGLDWRAMFAAGLKAYVLLGVEAESDCLEPAAALNGLGQAEFVVSLGAYDSDTLREHADVLLPVALYAETSGTLVNGEGRWQSFAAAAPAPGDARPAWRVLRVLGNLLDVDGFNYFSSEEVRDELLAACGELAPDNDLPWRCPQSLDGDVSTWMRLAEYPVYGIDPLVRRSAALQATAVAQRAVCVELNSATAEQAGISAAETVVVVQGEQELTLPLRIDETLADRCVRVPAGLGQSKGFGAAYAPLSLRGA